MLGETTTSTVTVTAHNTGSKPLTLKAVAVGTEIHIEQSGIPAAIPVEACYLGWQESLEQLAKLVVPTIPD